MIFQHPISLSPNFRFCTLCGQKVAYRTPKGDRRTRAICTNCQHIQHDNPKVVVCILPMQGDKLIMCKRGILPQKDLWTLPGAFVESGETVLQCAQRSALEIIGAHIELVEPAYLILDIPSINQIHLFFRANLLPHRGGGEFTAGYEMSEVAEFELRDIPWEQLAFASVKEGLEFFVNDAENERFPTRHHSISH